MRTTYSVWRYLMCFGNAGTDERKLIFPLSPPRCRGNQSLVIRLRLALSRQASARTTNEISKLARTAAILMSVVLVTTVPVRAADADLAPLPLKLPLPTLKGTPDDLPKGPNIEPPSEKPRPVFMAPKGARNVALNKKVTSSDRNPIFGELSQITDGSKEAFDDHVVEMRKGVQWVQIDLGEVCDIYAIVVWHDHRVLQVFRSVVVQAADDSDFIENVTSLFNNDTENSAGLGIGTDRQYFETQQGKLIPVKSGLKTRYLRFHTRGSNLSALNCYQEIEVYGQPTK